MRITNGRTLYEEQNGTTMLPPPKRVIVMLSINKRWSIIVYHKPHENWSCFYAVLNFLGLEQYLVYWVGVVLTFLKSMNFGGNEDIAGSWDGQNSCKLRNLLVAELLGLWMDTWRRKRNKKELKKTPNIRILWLGRLIGTFAEKMNSLRWRLICLVKKNVASKSKI